MNQQYVIKGRLVNHDTIKLAESLPWDDGEIQVAIDMSGARKYTSRDLDGIMKGEIEMSDDFDAPLEDFKEYMK
ncbi:MAG: hypothetical protein A2Y33_14930 [Spirochaetes bacterium GWF1_51_8]|nr:MAG: hypothetical protein A2Y33_14930 [Spirochaetes bacterium GWF1_51_8]